MREKANNMDKQSIVHKTFKYAHGFDLPSESTDFSGGRENTPINICCIKRKDEINGRREREGKDPKYLDDFSNYFANFKYAFGRLLCVAAAARRLPHPLRSTMT